MSLMFNVRRLRRTGSHQCTTFNGHWMLAVYLFIYFFTSNNMNAVWISPSSMLEPLLCGKVSLALIIVALMLLHEHSYEFYWCFWATGITDALASATGWLNSNFRSPNAAKSSSCTDARLCQPFIKQARWANAADSLTAGCLCSSGDWLRNHFYTSLGLGVHRFSHIVTFLLAAACLIMSVWLVSSGLRTDVKS